MKKKLLGLVLCLGFIFLFGTSNKNYEVSNIVYTVNNSNLIGKEVNVRGIDDTKFNIIGIDGKKVRLLSQNVTNSYYQYNSSGDGNIPVAFEKSMIYSVLMNNYDETKNKIASSGGDTSIFVLDIPTIEEFYDLGYLTRVSYEQSQWNYEYVKDNYQYILNDNTPEWLIKSNRDKKIGYFTKSISSDGKYVYAIETSLEFPSKSNDNVFLVAPYYGAQHMPYGASIRPVLETSAVNLVSSDSDVMSYVNSFAASNSNENKNDNSNNDKAQIVKVPSTGANAPLIFTVVGIAVIVIASIVIWVLVKNNKGKK